MQEHSASESLWLEHLMTLGLRNSQGLFLKLSVMFSEGSGRVGLSRLSTMRVGRTGWANCFLVSSFSQGRVAGQLLL